MRLQSKAISDRKDYINSMWQQVAENHYKLHDGSLAMTGWVDLPVKTKEKDLETLESAGKKIAAECSALVVIGIGGSYLGTRCLYKALRDYRTGVKLYFAGWNLSGHYHQRLLNNLDKEKDVDICVVSKSGSTMETSLAFDLLKDYMQRRYGENYADRVYAVTDPQKGILLEEAKEKNYHLFALDSEIGGRYSVLTCVGLLPLAAAGIDIKGLMDGAQRAYTKYNDKEIATNQCYQYAAYRTLMPEEDRNVEVFSFLEPELRDMGAWLQQLFAESEGKTGKGSFPSVLHYSTDLHSVGQFLEEGRPCLFETMISIKEHEDDLLIPGRKHSYNGYRSAVDEAVYKVRNNNNTPIVRIEMDDLSEESWGEIIYFFEKACAMCCLLQGLNPFDQPGVEAYKKEVKDLLK